MDMLAHVMYGATLCSRSGLAGGRKGRPSGKWYSDRTIWLTVFFSLLPDAVSMWIPFAFFMAGPETGIFFHHFGSHWLIVYRLAHSLLPALMVTALLWRFRQSWSAASLAWPVHIICDALTHGGGKWATMPLYPLSSFGIEGVRFWEHAWVMPAYWLVISLILALIVLIRRKKAGKRQHRERIPHSSR